MAEKSQFVTCLVREGDNVKKHRLITLSGKEEVTIGRSPEVTVCLLSTVVSRCHAVLKKTKDDRWTIRDNKSLNGIFVNGNRIDPDHPHLLNEGDVVQLGVPTKPNEPAEFVFKFHENIKIKRTRPKSFDEADGPTKSQIKYPVKRTKLENNNVISKNKLPGSDSQPTVSQPDIDKDAHPSTSKANATEWSPFKNFKHKLLEQEQIAQQKVKEFEEKLAEMQKLLKEKDEKQKEITNELEEEKKRREEKSKELEDALKRKEEEMALELKRKQEEEERLKEELDNQLLEREARLLEQLQSQKDKLLEEKEKVEKNLQKEMERALEEKDKALELQLIQEKEKLEKVITQKETEQKMLGSQLNETKNEKDQQKEALLCAREAVLSNFADLMETELQCSICNELFVQATSLQCSHAFCSLCITQWMKVKKDCPICRAPITSHVRSLILDNYIDKMAEHLSDELKERRIQLVKQRKEEQAKYDEAQNAKKPGTTQGTRGGRGRGRGRGRQRGRGGNTTATTNNEQGHNPIIIESDNNEEESSENMFFSSSESDDDDVHFYSNSDVDSDEDEEDDLPYIRGTGYYGGGACFRCGRSGHWAHGCPFR